MKLDRDENLDGKGKYALVRLRGIEKDDYAYGLLKSLDQLGYMDWGLPEATDEFFVIKLRDRSAAPALAAYANDAADYDEEWAAQVRVLQHRAESHPAKKTPD
jgi:hypothetical protein